jgi:hypothetical protein
MLLAEKSPPVFHTFAAKTGANVIDMVMIS